MLGLLPLYFCYALAELRQIVGKPFSPPESAKKNQTTKKKHIAKRRIIKNKRRVKRIKFKLNQVKLDEKRCRFWPTF